MRLLQILLFCLIIFTIAGCHNTPVRHLAADAGRLDVGASTGSEVLAIFGTPDRQIEQEGGSVWVYEEKKAGLVEDLPLLGDGLGSAEQVQLLVHFAGDTVSKVVYRAVDPDDLRWGQSHQEE